MPREELQSLDSFTQSLENLGLEKEYIDLASKLTSFGLTLNQGRLYLYLLSKPETIPARTVSAELGLHRVDTYRSLRQLVDLGIVELHIVSPNRYVAVDPNLALSSLLSKQESRISMLKELHPDLARRMLEFKNSSAMSSPELVLDYPGQVTYRVVSGRESYYREVRRLIRGASSEILRIISAYGLNLQRDLGFDKEYFKAARRGISIKIITEVDRDNLKQARRLSKKVEIRHLEGINARLSVVDGKITMFGHKLDLTKPVPARERWNCLVLADPQFAEVSHFLFERMWKLSTRFSDIDKKMKLKIKARN